MMFSLIINYENKLMYMYFGGNDYEENLHDYYKESMETVS